MRSFTAVLGGHRRKLAGAALAVAIGIPLAVFVQHGASVHGAVYDITPSQISVSAPVTAASGGAVQIVATGGIVSLVVPSDFGGTITATTSADGTITLTASEGAAAAGKSVTVCEGSVCKTVTFDAQGRATVKTLPNGTFTS